MIWALVYGALVALLVVRVRTTDAAVPEPAFPVPGEPLWLVRLHHRVFATLLLGAPAEALVTGGRPGGRVAGVCLFGLGVAAYRIAGTSLGEALSPLIEPRPGVMLVTDGAYRYLRHPMYVGQALIAVGAPLLLGCRWMLGLSAAALLVIAWRITLEEAALARTFPEYSRYAAKTKRIVPFVY